MATAPSSVSPSVPRRILRLPEVISRTGLHRDSIYRGARDGWFPRPVKLSERASGWLEDEINDFIERVTTERDTRALARETDAPKARECRRAVRQAST